MLFSPIYFWPIVTWFLIGLLVALIVRLSGKITMPEFLVCLVAWPAILYLVIAAGIKREIEHHRSIMLYKQAVRETKRRLDERLKEHCEKAGVDPERIKRRKFR